MGTLDGTAVLVADDDIDNLDLVTFLVGQAGGTVQTATSAREVLDLLLLWKPDVLLLDISMPDMDGYELLMAVRRLPALDEVPAVAITGLAFERDKQRAAEAGFDVYVTKPFEGDTLVETVASLIASAS